ncbi:MAG: DNA replication/repair protein RecF [Lentimicrobiaceae bacterium]|jgi:DNA replication and repair protein RecF|nr:DNA replication/repair protein RecF [Lentimicrobiaceae bacterium]
MHLQQLKLSNFKSYTEAKIAFSDKINCFIGLNGAGKTNLLDAVYYLSFCKSYFTSVDRQNIRHEADFFSIHGTYQHLENEKNQVSCVQKKEGKKSFRMNKKEYTRLADHIGKIPLVMISPYDRDLINDGSELRRKFIDGMISQFDANYLDTLLQYNKTLLQRNSQLKQFAENNYYDSELLALWDEKLMALSAPIYRTRIDFLECYKPLFQKYYEILSGGTEKITIQYESHLKDEPLSELFRQSLYRDRTNCYTNVGIHKDDFLFLLNDYPLKKYGSQGQQKSFLLALRLAQFDYTFEKLNYKPILLLDDIFDKLDDQRVARLVQLVGDNYFGQVFITDTQRERIEQLFVGTAINHKIFEVSNGKIRSLDQ